MTRRLPPRIFLTGLMGAGKTRVGRRLAEALTWRFIDLDEAIEASSGQSPAEIFASQGEDGFRRLERACLEGILEAAPPTGEVVALGGGTYVQQGVADWLREHGATVCLQVPPEILTQRLVGEEASRRPLLGDAPGEVLARLWQARREGYAKADRMVPAEGSPEAVAARVLTAVGSMNLGALHTLEVPLGPRTYPIWIGDGGADQIARMVGLLLEAQRKKPTRLAIISDQRVADLYLDSVASGLEKGGWPVVRVVVPEGEGSKSAAQLQTVWTALLEASFTRDDVVVALGGGVVGDLAGFAAATVLRGVRLIQVPTTVLSQVDSAVGGKTGINHPRGKNLVGAFHQPIGVVVGLRVLETLALRQVRSGLAEVAKMAAIDGEDAFRALEGAAQGLESDTGAIGEWVARCCAIKARIVAEDETEKGRRALLNLGHTFGHAIEAMQGFGGVTHGEAVALGMVLAARAARVLIGAPESLEQRLTALLRDLNLPADTKGHLGDVETMARLMARDKKATADRIAFILPRAIGEVEIVPVETRKVLDLLRRLASPESDH